MAWDDLEMEELEAKIAELIQDNEELEKDKTLLSAHFEADKRKIAELETMLKEKHEIIDDMHKMFLDNDKLHWDIRKFSADKLEENIDSPDFIAEVGYGIDNIRATIKKLRGKE